MFLIHRTSASIPKPELNPHHPQSSSLSLERILDQADLKTCLRVPGNAGDVEAVTDRLSPEPSKVFFRRLADAFLLASGDSSFWWASLIGSTGLDLHERQDRPIPAHQVEFTGARACPAVARHNSISGLAKVPVGQCLPAFAGLEVSWPSRRFRARKTSQMGALAFFPYQRSINKAGKPAHGTPGCSE